MRTIQAPNQPVPAPNIHPKPNAKEKLTSAEQAKLWTTYVGNSMAVRVLSYFLQHVDDQDIKHVLENAYSISEQIVEIIRTVFTQENLPVPFGFTEDDVNIGAERLFTDEFYLPYLKYTGKAGISIYGIAVPLMTRPDIREFFTQTLDSTVKLMNRINQLLEIKGLAAKPPYIPYRDKNDFIRKQNYLNGFFGDVRPLHGLEITHLFENVENNATSKAVLIGFSQVAQLEKVKSYFLRGEEIAAKHYDFFSKALEKEDLPAPPLLDSYVTTSTSPPFSDKLMMSHKLDMYSMRVRAYGNALAFTTRHDLSLKYGRLLLEVGNYVEDGANILISHGWIEEPPQAVDRQALAAESKER
ncbi:DUF3231 family protein [Cohnella caldifontis]|uniref:DUF3231 family protein n=1 Tax=Cohnella caldifontis TaxID=3027471 RepID=UPI0023EC3A9F|nr:DUF3231 family protein [Cohnella sp. YIM B05605]